jgi:3D (Asp-Asp-Asp) domain-containing protein
MPDTSAVRKEWLVHARSHPCYPVMTPTEEGLLLGAGTKIAAVQIRHGGWPVLAIGGDEERILALLAVAYGQPIEPSVLGNLRRASRELARGETVLAQIHIARSRLPPLPDDENAPFRLFLADKLLADGFRPRDLLQACGIDTAPLDLLKAGYDPDEPRVLAGNPDGGEWTTGDASGSPNPQLAAADGRGTAPITLHGEATVYNDRFNGRHTANGDIFDQNKITGAVLPGTIPLGSTVTVTLDSDPRRSVDVYVNDHGLYHPESGRPYPGRVIDLSTAAFRALTGRDVGKVRVTVTVKSAPPR